VDYNGSVCVPVVPCDYGVKASHIDNKRAEEYFATREEAKAIIEGTAIAKLYRAAQEAAKELDRHSMAGDINARAVLNAAIHEASTAIPKPKEQGDG